MSDHNTTAVQLEGWLPGEENNGLPAAGEQLTVLPGMGEDDDSDPGEGPEIIAAAAERDGKAGKK